VVQIRDGQVAEVMQAVPRPAQPTAPMPA
jgi:hypothetical protein